MLRKLGLLFATLAFFAIAGGHWAVLQSVAWAGMLHDYSQRSGSIATAVGQTFDGQHPCKLCREIQAAKSQERKDNPTTPNAKDDAKVKALLADSALPSFLRTAAGISFPRAAVLDGPRCAEPPPTPPPRSGSRVA